MYFKKELIKILSPITKLKQKEVDSLLEIPPDEKFGDYAFPCFRLGKNPVKKAKELEKKIKKTNFLEKTQCQGPYLNFFINKKLLAQATIKRLFKEKNCYGSSSQKKEKIMIEFSQPNPLKDFHIGHLRNTALGNSLVKILEFHGYKIIPVNLYNDTGAHVSKCIWAYLKFFPDKEPKKNQGKWLGHVYVKGTKKLTEKDHSQEIAEISQKIEAHDKEIIKIWKKLRDWSVSYFKEIYQELDVNFEIDFYDSDLIKPSKQIVKELLKKKIAQESQGAIIINLEKYNLDVALILRADGTSLYITKDLILAKQRFNKYKINKLIYVVGSEQSLHFQQLFKILELAGFKQAKNCYHLSYALVELPSGKMSSRSGNVVLYDELAEKLKQQIKKEIDKRHQKWPKNKKEKSLQNIFSAAIKFGMLSQENKKPIMFDLDKVLDFEGETGPYVQYAHARACSILRKARQKLTLKINFTTFNQNQEIKIIKILSKFPEIVEKAAQAYKPHLLARYLIDLAQAFNEFYHQCPVISPMKHVMKARLLLVDSVRQVLANGLGLLGIKAPEEM